MSTALYHAVGEAIPFLFESPQGVLDAGPRWTHAQSIDISLFVLARLGIVTAGFLLKNIKYAILLIFVVAAVVTPDGSMVVQTLMAAPMILLYLLGILVAWAFGKSKKPDDEESAT